MFGWPAAWFGLAAAVVAVAAMVGLTLLIVGLWPRRRGTEPFCRRCGYNLTGRAAAICTECGVSLTKPRAIRTGMRHRRRGLAFGGALLLLLAAAPAGTVAVIALRSVNWYPHAPAWLLFQFLDDPGDQQASRAFSELRNRFLTSAMNQSTAHKLIDWCVAEQGQPQMRPILKGTIIDLLGHGFRGHVMTPEQLDRFCGQCGFAQVRLRTPCLKQSYCPADIQFDARVPPGLTAQVHLTSADPDVDLSQPYPEIMYSPDPFWSDPFMFSFSEPPDHVTFSNYIGAGKRDVVFVANVELFDGQSAPARGDRPTHAAKRLIHVPIEILEHEPPGYVRPSKSADLEREIRAAIREVQPHIESTGGGTRCLFVDVPVSRAFSKTAALEVSIDGFSVDGFPVTQTLTIPAGKSSLSGFLSSSVVFYEWGASPDHLASRVSVTIRGSREAALNTVDLFEFWGGELHFENVPVRASSREYIQLIRPVQTETERLLAPLRNP